MADFFRLSIFILFQPVVFPENCDQIGSILNIIFLFAGFLLFFCCIPDRFFYLRVFDQRKFPGLLVGS
jgi:hypothetical protein